MKHPHETPERRSMTKWNHKKAGYANIRQICAERLCLMFLLAALAWPVWGGPAIDPQTTYRKPVIYATWIMIWIGSTEKWWQAEEYNGCTVPYPEGLTSKKSIDWNDPALRRFYLEQIRDAGIDVLVIDFTNGARWKQAARDVQKFCYENNMKMCIAFNPKDGSAMEANCKSVWETYAAPSVQYADAYFKKSGKPLCVIYAGRSSYAASVAQAGEARRRFATVWTSGEDGAEDKWGWQLVPYELARPSADSMFVTSASKWNSPKGTAETWRKSLAVLDYNLLVARKTQPRFVIIGAYDDVHERNGWLKLDTARAIRGMQMRDVQGNLSREVYYERVRSWIKETNAPVFVKGGLIRDGAYRVINASSGLGFSSVPPTPRQSEDLGAPMLQRGPNHRPLGAVETYYWFYHLGNNEFRIVHLSSALSLADEGGIVKQVWDEPSPSQRWKLEKTGENYALVNAASGKCLSVENSQPETKLPTVSRNGNDRKQQWKLVPVLLN